MESRIFLFWFATIVCFQIQIFSEALDFYSAAVVEYSPAFDADKDKMLEENAKNYQDLIETASSKKVDIIVFPEGGLTTTIVSTVPDPTDDVNPCKNEFFDKFEDCEGVKWRTSLLSCLSCLARKHHIYLVVNLPESRFIDDSNGKLKEAKFNTNVVFDRNGAVIARYAKYNLFDEFNTTKPDKPELAFFDTEFNVRFGTFTCFDILFPEPALRLIRQYNVKNFLFTSQWFSELPFLTALQVQRGWAEANDVNLLASGYNDPRRGSTGSGIFNGREGSLVHYMGNRRGTKLLIAMVPIKSHDVVKASLPSNPQPKQLFSSIEMNLSNKTVQPFVFDDFQLLSDQIDLFQSEIIESGSDFVTQICSQFGFCCNFNIRLDQLKSNPKGFNYRAVAFNGVRRFGLSTTGGVQACGVILCSGPKIGNCTKLGVNFEGIYEFSKIEIEGNFKTKNSIQFPSTLIVDDGKLDTLPPHKYDFNRTLNLEWPVENLQTFAIWGRDFTRDGRKPSLPVAEAPRLRSFLSLIITPLVFVFMLY